MIIFLRIFLRMMRDALSVSVRRHGKECPTVDRKDVDRNSCYFLLFGFLLLSTLFARCSKLENDVIFSFSILTA